MAANELRAVMAIRNCGLEAKDGLFVRTFEGYELSSILSFCFIESDHEKRSFGQTFAGLVCGPVPRLNTGLVQVRPLGANHAEAQLED